MVNLTGCLTPPAARGKRFVTTWERQVRLTGGLESQKVDPIALATKVKKSNLPPELCPLS